MSINKADYITPDESLIEDNALDQDVSIKDLVKSLGMTQRDRKSVV